MDVKRVLQELIAIPEQREVIASVYLNTRWADEHQREAVRVFVSEQARRAVKAQPNEEGRHKLAATFQPIEDYVAGLLRQRHDDWATGVAIFSCPAINLFRVIATRMPFDPMEFRLGPRPYLTPIVSTLASVPTLLLATVDSEGGSVFEVSCGVVANEDVIDRFFPGGHSQGGWRQLKISHRLGNLREQNLRAVAEPFARRAEALPDALLVLSGQHFILNTFEALLPERVRERIVARLPHPPSPNDGEVRLELLQDAQPLVEAAVRAQRLAERDVALAEAARGGLGVAGVSPTLLALTEGRTHRVFIDRGWHAQGFSCQRCGALAEKGGSGCGYCAGELKAVEFPDEIVRRAVGADAEISFLPLDAPLPDGAHLAAQLRHRGTAQPNIGVSAPT